MRRKEKRTVRNEVYGLCNWVDSRVMNGDKGRVLSVPGRWWVWALVILNAGTSKGRTTSIPYHSLVSEHQESHGGKPH